MSRHATAASSWSCTASLSISVVNSAPTTPMKSRTSSDTTRAIRRSVSNRNTNERNGGRFRLMSRSGSGIGAAVRGPPPDWMFATSFCSTVTLRLAPFSDPRGGYNGSST